jgi:hypothetical protein
MVPFHKAHTVREHLSFLTEVHLSFLTDCVRVSSADKKEVNQYKKTQTWRNELDDLSVFLTRTTASGRETQAYHLAKATHKGGNTISVQAKILLPTLSHQNA